MRRGTANGSRDCLVVGPRLVEAGAASLTLHPRSAKQMYTGHADHSLTAELVVARRRAGDRLGRRHLARPGAGGARDDRRGRGDGRPRRAGQPVGARARSWATPTEPSREEVVAELLLFIRETVRELGEYRATGFLKKFYGWYLGRGRFPKPFKQELVTLPTIDGGRAAPARRRARRREVLERLEASCPTSTRSCSTRCRSRSTAAADDPDRRPTGSRRRSNLRSDRLPARASTVPEPATRLESPRAECSAISLPDEAQALQRQLRVDGGDRPRVRRDQLGEAARSRPPARRARSSSSRIRSTIASTWPAKP